MNMTKKAPQPAAKPRPRKAQPPADPSAWRRVGRLQLAELIGVHPDTVSDYTRGGMPTITRGGAGQESVYDAVESLAWWRAQQGHNAKEAAQTRAYEAAAKMNEQRLMERRSELVSRDAVLLAGASYTKAWSAKVRSLPRRFIETGLITRAQEGIVSTLCREILTEISSWKTVVAPKPRKRKAK
jgi:hypothetical protein